MRLFHYALIPVLDNKHLVAQWRECIAIKRQWEKGTLKHRLVSYVMNYDKKYFLAYINRVVKELTSRNINFDHKKYMKLADWCVPNMPGITQKPYLDFTYPEHNDRYLKQCCFNLQEKFDRKIITKEEWQKIYDKYGDKFDLWVGEFNVRR